MMNSWISGGSKNARELAELFYDIEKAGRTATRVTLNPSYWGCPDGLNMYLWGSELDTSYKCKVSKFKSKIRRGSSVG